MLEKYDKVNEEFVLISKCHTMIKNEFKCTKNEYSRFQLRRNIYYDAFQETLLLLFYFYLSMLIMLVK